MVYVAMLDAQDDRIEFPYYSERGKRLKIEPLPRGSGLTSRILASGEPLLLNRTADYGDIERVGTPSSSYLGVPILVGERAIGVISVQSIDEAGRFGDDDKRLLSTLAANVGVAIQNARLYRDSQRRAGEMAALVDVSSEISAMLELRPVIERIAERALTLLGGDTSAVFLADAEGRTYPALVALGSIADAVMALAIEPGQGILGDLVRRGAAEVVNDTVDDPRTITIEGTSPDEHDRLMAAPLLARGAVAGMMAVWRAADRPAVHRRRPRLPGEPLPAGGHRHRERAPVRGGPRRPGGGRGGQPGQEHLPGGHESRDPHPDERHHRHERAAP